MKPLLLAQQQSLPVAPWRLLIVVVLLWASAAQGFVMHNHNNNNHNGGGGSSSITKPKAVASSLRPLGSGLTFKTKTTPTSTSLPSFLGGGDDGFLPSLFPSKQAKKAAALPIKPKYEKVVIDPDFRVAALFLVVGGLLDWIPYLQLTLGPLVTLLGVLFFVQTFRIQFVFDEDNNLALLTSNEGDNDGDGVGENVIVGGANRWSCNKIVNYDFFPQDWMNDGNGGLLQGQPILVYFKETQTPSESWNQGPGQSANDPAKIAAGQAVAGQVHFFPAVCNAQQLRQELEKRGCGKL